MFFSSYNFKELNYLDKDQLEHIARVANDIIESHATVVYGRALGDGSLGQFSNTKEHTDTHVALAIGIKQMAMFALEDSYIKKDRAADKEDISKDITISNQKKELERLRVTVKERLNP